MRIAAARTDSGPRIVLDVGDGMAVMTAYRDLRTALADGITGLNPKLVTGMPVEIGSLDLGPTCAPSAKVLCIGHNFRQHILEMGHGFPDFPNVFSKFPEALVGPRDPIVLDPASACWDWEAELALIIGSPARHVAESDAQSHIAGYAVANDISARDWQRRSTQWLMGKTFESTTPLGPWLVTPDEVDPRDGLELVCSVDGVEKQRSTTSDLLFGPHFLVSYLSQVVTLQPGDVILTGTPAGVGTAREPAEFLSAGQIVTTSVEGLGHLSNTTAAPSHVSA